MIGYLDVGAYHYSGKWLLAKHMILTRQIFFVMIQ